MFERMCVHCRGIFNPIEGNETRDFCSDDCELEYYDTEDNTDHYNYGRK